MLTIPSGKTPVWFTAIIVVCMLPALAFPSLLSRISPTAPAIIKTLVWGYPFYVMLTGWLARQSYTVRPTLAWILLALMTLSHIAIWTCVNQPL